MNYRLYNEIILKMQETDEIIIGLMMPPSQHNADIWDQCIQAAFHIGENAYIEKHKDAVLQYGTVYDRFMLLWKLAELYKEENLTEEYIAAREEVVSMMPGMKWENYIAERMEYRLQQL